ncbi:unnamed protein product, partial [Pylaiella littoralis]
TRLTQRSSNPTRRRIRPDVGRPKPGLAARGPFLARGALARIVRLCYGLDEYFFGFCLGLVVNAHPCGLEWRSIAWSSVVKKWRSGGCETQQWHDPQGLAPRIASGKLLRQFEVIHLHVFIQTFPQRRMELPLYFLDAYGWNISIFCVREKSTYSSRYVI